MNQINTYARQQALGAGIPETEWKDAQAIYHNPQKMPAAGNQLGVAAPPMGIVAMIDNSHEAFQRLSNALGELQAVLSPIIEPYPEPDCGVKQQDQLEAPAVDMLRHLVNRIDGKTTEIHRLLSALRV